MAIGRERFSDYEINAINAKPYNSQGAIFMASDSAMGIFFRGLIYPFTSMKKLIGGFLAGFGCFFLIGLPVVLGFGVHCGRNILKGNDKLPEWGSDSLFNDGVKALAIWLPYTVLIYLISHALRLVLGTTSFDLNDPNLLWQLVKWAINFVTMESILMMLWISMIIFIDTGNVQRAFNPLNGLKLLVSRPFEFIKAMVLAYIATFIVSLPLIALIWLAIARDLNICILFLVLFAYLAFLFYTTICIHVFIWTKFYMRGTGKNIGTPALVFPGPN